MRRSINITYALIALIAFNTAPAHAQDGPVLSKEIQDTWVGKEITGTTARGASVSIKLGPDGTASVSAGKTSDTGTWRLSESGYCTTWKTIRAGQEGCFTVTRSGSTFNIANPDGSTGGQFTAIK